MKLLLNMSAAASRISSWIGLTAGWLILPLIFVIVVDVITRKIDFTRLLFSEFTIKFGYSVSTILQDLQWHLHGIILLLGFAFAYNENAHVRVDVFRERLSKRFQGWIELILLIVFALPFLIVATNYAFTLFNLSLFQWEGSDSLTGIGWRWLIKAFMPLGFFIAILSVLSTIGRLIIYLIGSDKDSELAEGALQIFTSNHEDLDAVRNSIEQALQNSTIQKHGD